LAVLIVQPEQKDGFKVRSIPGGMGQRRVDNWSKKIGSGRGQIAGHIKGEEGGEYRGLVRTWSEGDQGKRNRNRHTQVNPRSLLCVGKVEGDSDSRDSPEQNQGVNMSIGRMPVGRRGKDWGGERGRTFTY